MAWHSQSTTTETQTSLLTTAVVFQSKPASLAASVNTDATSGDAYMYFEHRRCNGAHKVSDIRNPAPFIKRISSHQSLLRLTAASPLSTTTSTVPPAPVTRRGYNRTAQAVFIGTGTPSAALAPRLQMAAARCCLRFLCQLVATVVRYSSGTMMRREAQSRVMQLAGLKVQLP